MNGLELAVDDTRALYVLRRGVKTIARTPSSRARVTRDLAKLNAFPLAVLTYRSHWERTRHSSCSCLTRAVTSCK